MLDFLFRRLTTDRSRGAELFQRVSAIARQPHWYVEGAVPDTLDGRFAVLATVAALVLVRLESSGEAGDAASVALTERFIEVMESEHRELGLGDPTLGKTVRRLVGSLSRRTDLWRSAVSGEKGWPVSTRESLYKSDPEPEATAHSEAELKDLWNRLERSSVEEIAQGKIG